MLKSLLGALVVLGGLPPAAVSDVTALEQFSETWSAPHECPDWRASLSEHWTEDEHLRRCDAQLGAFVVRDEQSYRLVVTRSERDAINGSTSYASCEDAVQMIDVLLRFNCAEAPPPPSPTRKGGVGLGALAGPAIGEIAPRGLGSLHVGLLAELHVALDLQRVRLELFGQVRSPTTARTEVVPGRSYASRAAEFAPVFGGARACLAPVGMMSTRRGRAAPPIVEVPLCAAMAAGAVVGRGLPVDEPPDARLDPWAADPVGWSAHPWVGLGGSVGLLWRAHARVQLHARIGGLASILRSRPAEGGLGQHYPEVGPGAAHLVLGVGVPLHSFPLRDRQSADRG